MILHLRMKNVDKHVKYGFSIFSGKSKQNDSWYRQKLLFFHLDPFVQKDWFTIYALVDFFVVGFLLTCKSGIVGWCTVPASGTSHVCVVAG
jgi:hypothetical protein